MKLSRGIVLLFAGIVLFLPVDFQTQNMDQILMPPSGQYWLGTDSLGRDLFARIFFGLRFSVIVGLLSSVLSICWALGFSFLSTSMGNVGNRWALKFLDIISSIPSLIWISVICLWLDSFLQIENSLIKSLVILNLGISLTHWMGMARVLRGHVLEIKSTLYFDSSKLMGASSWKLFQFHVIPHLKPVVFRLWLIQLPMNIVYEGTISYIGLGVHPPYVSLGLLLRSLTQFLFN